MISYKKGHIPGLDLDIPRHNIMFPRDETPQATGDILCCFSTAFVENSLPHRILEGSGIFYECISASLVFVPGVPIVSKCHNKCCSEFMSKQ